MNPSTFFNMNVTPSNPILYCHSQPSTPVKCIVKG